MSKAYRPSNGTEAMIFEERFCDHCTKDSEDSPCDIICRSFSFQKDEPEYPTEWIVDDDGLSNPRCTAFEDKDAKGN